MYQFTKGMFGTYSGSFGFADGEIYIGEVNHEIHIEVSYSSIGAMHQKVKVGSVTETAVEFFLDLNNIDHLVHLEYRENELIGSLRINNDEISLHFKKINNTYKFSEPFAIIPQQYVELLIENSSYERKQKSVNITYDLNNAQVLSYLHEVGIETENKHDFSTVLELLRQLCIKIHHDGVNYAHCKEHGTVAQIRHALSQNSFTNCRGVAIIFSGILRAYGFRSSYVTCFPYNKDDKECHVVCEVYIEELNKFIFIDPSNQAYFIRSDKVLNLLELRECIQNNEDITYYQDASHNGEPFDLIGYLGYFSKNIFYFVKSIKNSEEKEAAADNSICFVPIEYQEIVKNKFQVLSSNINDYYQ